MIPYTLKQRTILSLLIIPIVIILYPSFSFSGVESVKNEKNPPPPLKGQVLFEELFQDNKNNWLIEENPLFKINIENGKYVLEQLSDGKEKAIINYKFRMPDNIDFKIEATFEKIQGADNLGYGLIWGAVDINNQQRFYVSDNGNYTIRKYEKGKESDVTPWKKYRENGQILKNKLTIVKSNCFTRFYVNDEYLDEIRGLSLDGNKVGFVIDGKQKAAVDDIVVTKIEAEEIPSYKKCPEPQPTEAPLLEQKEEKPEKAPPPKE